MPLSGLQLTSHNHRQYICAVCDMPVKFFAQDFLKDCFQLEINVRCHGQKESKKIDLMDNRKVVTFFE